VVCHPLLQATFEVANEDPAALGHLSHHNIHNAFHKACFGGDPEGVHGCTPPEMLHLYQQGLYKYALESFTLSLTTEQKRGLDQLISTLSNTCCRQSDRTFPRFRFPKGITNLSCFTAAEQVGIILVCLLAISMRGFESVVLRYNQSKKSYAVDHDLLGRCQDFATLFESMLTAEAWMNQNRHKTSEIKNVAPSKITHLMHAFKNVVNRTEGNGLKIPKFHQLKHLPRYILKFGSPNNFSTSRCESHHIQLSKKPAATAQKRDECFETQVGQRIVDAIVLTRATQTLLVSPSIGGTKKEAAAIYGTRFTVVKLELGGCFCAVPMNGSKSQLPIEQKLLDLFGQAFHAYFPPNDGIPCFTEHKRLDPTTNQTFIFRGHPMFRGKSWNDWALFKWNSDDSSVSDQSLDSADDTIDIPGRILFFLDATAMANHPDYEPGLYAVTQSLLKKPTSCGRRSFLSKGSMSPKVTFVVCHVDSIVDVSFVIPNIGAPNEYLVLQSPVHWPELFIK